jgi:hypothetical protein
MIEAPAAMIGALYRSKVRYLETHRGKHFQAD